MNTYPMTEQPAEQRWTWRDRLTATAAVAGVMLLGAGMVYDRMTSSDQPCSVSSEAHGDPHYATDPQYAGVRLIAQQVCGEPAH